MIFLCASSPLRRHRCFYTALRDKLHPDMGFHAVELMVLECFTTFRTARISSLDKSTLAALAETCYGSARHYTRMLLTVEDSRCFIHSWPLCMHGLH